MNRYFLHKVNQNPNQWKNLEKNFILKLKKNVFKLKIKITKN